MDCFISRKLKRATILSLFLFIMAIPLVQSCKKEKRPVSPVPGFELLTSGTWEIEAAGFDDDSSGSIELHENIVTECQQDNTLQFFVDGSGISKENGLICNADSLSKSFTWAFTQSETHLLISNTEMHIRRLDSQQMVLAWELYLNTPFLIQYVNK